MSYAVFPAIIAERSPIHLGEHGPTCYSFLYRLAGKIFGADIQVLADNIFHYLEEYKATICKITIDISETHAYLFKPSRFFGLCSDVSDKLKLLSSNGYLTVVIGKQHIETFDQIQDLFDFQIEVSEEIGRVIKPTKLTWITEIKNIFTNILLYGFPLILILGCIIGIYISVTMYYNTRTGYLIYICGGLLIYEAILIIKLNKNKEWDNK